MHCNLYTEIYRPLPIAMVWSPSDARLVKREGSHCIICSEANPRIAQLVRMETKTMAFMTDNHTPMSFTLCIGHPINIWHSNHHAYMSVLRIEWINGNSMTNANNKSHICTFILYVIMSSQSRRQLVWSGAAMSVRWAFPKAFSVAT